nr:unnamed protein product [Callosobruchus analis]
MKYLVTGQKLPVIPENIVLPTIPILMEYYQRMRKWNTASPPSDKITLKDLARNEFEANNENILSNRIKKEYDYSINPENRYECDICNKSYKNKRHLYRHQKEECIGVEPKFKCEVCSNMFRRKYHLSRHMSNRHGIDMKFERIDEKSDHI